MNDKTLEEYQKAQNKGEKVRILMEIICEQIGFEIGGTERSFFEALKEVDEAHNEAVKVLAGLMMTHLKKERETHKVDDGVSVGN